MGNIKSEIGIKKIEKKIRIIVKGHIHTDVLMKEVLKREYDLLGKTRLSHIWHMTIGKEDKPLIITDGALNVLPNVKTKMHILKNVINFSNRIGIEKPKVAILSGSGTSSYGVGEIWHLTNSRMKIPSSLLNAENLNKWKLANYNTIIVPDGYYQELESIDIQNLKEWVLNGGTLIGTQTGSQWLINKKIII